MHAGNKLIRVYCLSKLRANEPFLLGSPGRTSLQTERELSNSTVQRFDELEERMERRD